MPSTTIARVSDFSIGLNYFPVRIELTLSYIELPQPRSGFLERLRNPDTSATPEPRPNTPPAQQTPVQEPGSTRSRPPRRESLGGLDADPWGSPELHRNHDHAPIPTDQRVLNGYGSIRSTTNAWSSKTVEETTQSEVTREHTNGRTEPIVPSSAGSGWGGNIETRVEETGFGAPPPPTLGGFGAPADGPGDPAPRRRSLGMGRPTNLQVEETVTINLLQEKEGMFMFQHRNYEVKSARRGSTVVRRYSDFVWLLDCLQKRFPFRQLPLLPPKRVSGTFNAD